MALFGSGYTAQMLNERLQAAGIVPSAIDIIGGVEATTKDDQKRVFEQTEILCRVAKEIGAPTIQLNAFEG